MICDVAEIEKIKYYMTKNGPFVFTFYEQDSHGQNFELYSHLKSLEIEFNDLPIIRWNYHIFILYVRNINVPSPNHLMVLEKNEIPKTYDTKNKNDIPNILLNVRRRILLHRNNFCRDFTNGKRVSLKPFIVNSSKHTVSDIQKYLNMTAEEEYKFPNNTAYSFRNKMLQEKEKSLEISGNDACKPLSLLQKYQSVIKHKHLNHKYNFKITIPQRIHNSNKICKLLLKSQNFEDCFSNKSGSKNLNFFIINKPNNDSIKYNVDNSKLKSYELLNKSMQNRKIGLSSLN